MIGKCKGEYLIICDYGGRSCQSQMWTGKTKQNEAEKVAWAAKWKRINGLDKCPNC